MDEVLFASFVPAAVCSTFDTIATKGMEAVPWVDAELAIHLLFIYGEACKGPVTFFEEENKSNRPTALGQMIISMLKSSKSQMGYTYPSPTHLSLLRYLCLPSYIHCTHLL